MEQKFVDKNGNCLIIKHRKSAIFFEKVANENNIKKSFYRDEYYYKLEELKCLYEFEKEVWEEMIAYFEKIAIEAWKEFKPKYAESFREDYFEYYDREFDGNGYIRIRENSLQLEGPAAQAPNGQNARLYKFNKLKFQTFMYDLLKIKK